jgi:hypothetical protein
MRFHDRAIRIIACLIGLQATLCGQGLITEWKKEAIRNYPELAVRDSALNKAYLEIYRTKKETEPAFFSKPKWPVLLAREAKAASLQVSQSLRPNFEKWMPIIRDQGRRNTCDAHSVAEIIEYERHAKGEHVRLSPEFLYWAAGESTRDRRNRMGYETMKVIAAVRKYGVCAEELMPYGQKSRPSKEALADALKRNGISIKMLTKQTPYAALGKGFTQQEIDNICAELAKGHPVLVDTQFPMNVELDGNKIMQLTGNKEDSRTGHTITAVGCTRVKDEGVVEFRNTYGPGFCDKGYVKITFEFLRSKGAQAFSIEVP